MSDEINTTCVLQLSKANLGPLTIRDECKNKTMVFKVPDNEWAMKISSEGIQFNREAYPNATPDEFANTVIDILEKCFAVSFERKDAHRMELPEPPYE